jgi:hypothetical protein
LPICTKKVKLSFVNFAFAIYDANLCKAFLTDKKARAFILKRWLVLSKRINSTFKQSNHIRVLLNRAYLVIESVNQLF